MEDLPEKSTTQSQSEEQPAETIGAETQPADEAVQEARAAEQPAEQPRAAVETAPQPQETAPAAVEAAEAPAETAPAPARPVKPTGPRLAALRPGSVVEGKVTRIERYGAFVDLGLVEKRDGLIHISELAPYRVRRVEDVVKVGDAVRTRVVSVDLGRGRIALSMNDVDAQEYSAEPAVASNEPTLTAMAAAFERAYGRSREKGSELRPNGSRPNQGDRKRREQEMLMEKFRSAGR